MNGFSLWMALAAVGVSGQTELGPGGVPIYNIRIESALLDELRRGEQVTQSVAIVDRQARRFKISVTPERPLPSRTLDGAGRADSLVKYEPVQLQNNDLEMWVQLSPERVEILAQGRPIEGELPPEIAAVRAYRIFVGVGRLPSEQAGLESHTAPSAPHLLNADASLAPADARAPFEPSSSRISAPPVRPTFIPGGNASTAAVRGATNPTLTNPWVADSRSALRNGPDQSSMAPPPTDRYAYPQEPFNAPQPGPPAGGYASDSQYRSPASSYPPNTYPQPMAYERAPLGGYGNVPQQPPPQSPPSPQPQWPPSGWTPPPFAQPATTTLAARPENGPAAATVPETTPAAAPAVIVKSAEDAQPKSSTPLILTTLALFTSLGVNTYLGWLAYSFFWRYRDAVNDSLRARSQNAPGRLAA